jgi:hypothetical protein
VAHLDAAQQHPVKGNEDRDLHQDGQAAAQGIDLFLAVQLHHLLIHAIAVRCELLLDFH